VKRAYVVNRAIYEDGLVVQDNKTGLVVELGGWFGRGYLEALARELEPVLHEYWSTYWSSMSNSPRKEVHEAGLLVFDRRARS
jgi:hypothetical protein